MTDYPEVFFESKQCYNCIHQTATAPLETSRVELKGSHGLKLFPHALIRVTGRYVKTLDLLIILAYI